MIPDEIKRNTSFCSVLYGVNSCSSNNSDDTRRNSGLNDTVNVSKLITKNSDVGSSKHNSTVQIEKHDASAFRFDIVLMDNSMPKMCGPDATMAMRSLGFKGPIIGITGHEDTAEFMLAGADIVLCKPINRKILYDTMKVMMKGEKRDVGKRLSMQNPHFMRHGSSDESALMTDKFPKHLLSIQNRRDTMTHNSFISDHASYLCRQSSLYGNYRGILGSSNNPSSRTDTKAASLRVDGNHTGGRSSTPPSPVSPVSGKGYKMSFMANRKWSSRVGSSCSSVKISAVKEQNECEDLASLSVEESNIMYAGKKILPISSSPSSFKSNDVSSATEFKDSNSLEIKDDVSRVLYPSLKKPLCLTHQLSPSTASEICEAV
jgi:CheY-like chemotaxis protein